MWSWILLQILCQGAIVCVIYNTLWTPVQHMTLLQIANCSLVLTCLTWSCRTGSGMRWGSLTHWLTNSRGTPNQQLSLFNINKIIKSILGYTRSTPLIVPVVVFSPLFSVITCSRMIRAKSTGDSCTCHKEMGQ